MYEPKKYGDSYTYPGWAEALGWLMTLASLVPILVYAIYYVWNQEGPIKQVSASTFINSQSTEPCKPYLLKFL